MKIAVTSMGRDLASAVDPRFGRAAYILIVDTDTKDCKVIDNTVNVSAFKGAGIQAATMIAEEGAEVLLTGYCGPNAFRILEAAGIKVGSDISGTVADVVVAFVEGKINYIETANAEGHW
ncbi:MAG: NifB/NifX family molybdenum-iron cluster-binding protein [Desulfoprunum sp.]|uniref:NifB/NifX family molybdenum-iron cluster-binding protein n=1 Tax=Desulfoprunum sp. TaxID=2020866 RepID=UPI00052BB961|nr:dinitrogenase iron-molybdenum cofactor biosynthesis protein [Desulfobulbus sp. Tol-SR]